MIAVPWIENPETAEAKAAESLQQIVGSCGIKDLQEFVTLLAYAYDYCCREGEYHAYVEIQAFNELIYTFHEAEIKA